ncbi:MAG: hypothetical protein KKE61_18345, partial [Proteobacteria bacterium]|nr:hypothetical protein [Pseudomonadota bacterium]
FYISGQITKETKTIWKNLVSKNARFEIRYSVTTALTLARASLTSEALAGNSNLIPPYCQDHCRNQFQDKLPTTKFTSSI